MVEAKLSGTLQQYHLIVQLLESIAAHESLYRGVEALIGQMQAVGMVANVWANANELLHAALGTEARHLRVELVGSESRLQDVAQYQCASAVLVVRTSVHKVEGNVQRVDVRVVAVVDEGAAMLPLFHLKAHGHGFKGGHTLCQSVGAHAQV